MKQIEGTGTGAIIDSQATLDRKNELSINWLVLLNSNVVNLWFKSRGLKRTKGGSAEVTRQRWGGGEELV